MSLLESFPHSRRSVLLSGLGVAAAGALGATAAHAAPPGLAQGEIPGTGGVFHVPAGTGLGIWLAGDTYMFKATAERTNGSFALVEASVPPAGGPPLHTHADSDESFYVVSGALEFQTNDQVLIANAGDFIFVPRGTPHRFKNIGVPTVRLLFMFAPGGPDKQLIEWGTPAQPGVPVPPPAPEEAARMAGVWP